MELIEGMCKKHIVIVGIRDYSLTEKERVCVLYGKLKLGP